MERIDILKQLSFGERIAEEERDQLRKYFMSTDPYYRVLNGEVDVIYGPKGSGKSAIYSIIESESEDLAKRNIKILSAENPRGSTAFSGLSTDPPTSEIDFVNLWKLYFILLLNKTIQELKIKTKDSDEINETLQKSNLIPASTGLKSILSAAYNYIKQLSKIESIQPGVDLNELSGVPNGISFKISFREPNLNEVNGGIISIEKLFELADSALKESSISLWILIDRLDVAFSDNLDLETNALRALFKVYNDLKPFSRIILKVFLRNDIWKRITKSGFREASHVTKTITIDWSKESILNLIILRILNNEAVIKALKIDRNFVVKDIGEQEKLFYRLFPDQVDQGAKKPKTLDWIITRVKDGQGVSAPREVIHLLNEAKTEQIRKIELGENEAAGDALIGRAAMKAALDKVSKVRLEQTIYAEFPSLIQFIEELKTEKAEQTTSTLARIWGKDINEAREIARELHSIGLFEERGTKQEPRYWTLLCTEMSLT
ncbi:hypothetical protein C8P68_11187 [Mucilaginibacter yixingensis]|uniref:Uncharacterized protein n=1 Tax=Mucilaginibacter yixingensis TaxID=1295612 RepID=A0A2T5J4W6_9SPHI|nr:hypothetical protein [Mucilaginibacter yixingensis]PTQ92710.1 hypothetical protein C8P68_11187 [Mucilaginibacter yixingensis]